MILLRFKTLILNFQPKHGLTCCIHDSSYYRRDPRCFCSTCLKVFQYYDVNNSWRIRNSVNNSTNGHSCQSDDPSISYTAQHYHWCYHICSTTHRTFNWRAFILTCTASIEYEYASHFHILWLVIVMWWDVDNTKKQISLCLTFDDRASRIQCCSLFHK